MTEQELEKVIKLKEQLDRERELFRFATKQSVRLEVLLRDNGEYGHSRDMGYILGNEVIKELRKQVLSNIEKRVGDLLSQIEKL